MEDEEPVAGMDWMVDEDEALMTDEVVDDGAGFL